MKVALVGSSGYIAEFILKRLKEEHNEILKVDQSGDVDEILNLTEPESFNYEVLNDINFVIFTAAISGPDICASDYERCWSINVTGTSFFIKEAIKRECKVLFFSSDAVYGDIPEIIYDELSETQARTPYGRMKKKIEDEFKENPNFKAIRLSYVVSAKDKFVSYCLGCIERKEIAEVFHPFYRNCIAVSDVVNVVMWLLKYWDVYNPFVLCVTGKELVSRVRIADEINRIKRGKLQYKILYPGEEFYKNRPKITQMRSEYLEEYRILKSESFTEKIQRELI